MALSVQAKKRLKKLWKKVYLKQNRHQSWEEYNQEQGVVGLINTFQRHSENGESFKRVWIFDGLTPEQVERELNKVTYVEGYWPNSAYDCTGAKFLWHCEIFPQTSGRVFVQQRGGYDL